MLEIIPLMIIDMTANIYPTRTISPPMFMWQKLIVEARIIISIDNIILTRFDLSIKHPKKPIENKKPLNIKIQLSNMEQIQSTFYLDGTIN